MVCTFQDLGAVVLPLKDAPQRLYRQAPRILHEARFDQEILEAIQLGLQSSGGAVTDGRRRFNQTTILQLVIRHYWDLLLEHGNPELVEAIREKVTSSPEKFSISATLESMLVYSNSSTESGT